MKGSPACEPIRLRSGFVLSLSKDEAAGSRLPKFKSRKAGEPKHGPIKFMGGAGLEPTAS